MSQEFNTRTAHYNPGTPIPARIIVRPDRSFTFTLKTPPTALLLLAAAGVVPTKNKMKGAGNTAGARHLAAVVRSAGTALNAASDRQGQTPNTDGSANDAMKQDSSLTSGYEKALASKGKSSGSAKEVKPGNSLLGTVGAPVSLKHVYEIARIKQIDNASPLEAIATSVVAQAGSMGVVIVP